ncbi:unnamed protein product [Didymodactylos carnosus]|uniref:Uncharacterized protein n=2 Tax=Didymodactylos carnosus TaxID=1234261 RepID=A0A8S2E590_9BILA|nr:unnamed protein product [Didymodactylos carnosus]CAF3925210.1 unnamed protein product [Didymodactylos carnosus]
MASQTPKNQQNASNDKLNKYRDIFADIGYNYHITKNIIKFWSDGFAVRQALHESLTKVLNEIQQNSCESNLRWQKHQKLQEEIKVNCTRYLTHFQSEYAPDCHQEFQQLSDQCFGDNSNEVDQTKINQLIKKMDTEMIKKFEDSLSHQVWGATFSLIAMCIMVQKTSGEIKNSKTYRESDKLRSSIQKVEDGIEESESYLKPYEVPINRLSDLIRTQESYSALRDLKYGKQAIDFAKRELYMILSEIDAHSESIQQRKDINVHRIINNTIKLIGNGVLYMQTPRALLTSAALASYGAITGIEVTSIAGHAFGVYWSQEELTKLSELKQDMNELQDCVNDIFLTISLIEQKLTIID